MNINQIQELASNDMNAVNQLIFSQLESDVALINQLGMYIVNAGGKRMRPLLTVLAARAMGYSGDKHLCLAAIIEFIHTATLLHDDVVDESSLRRGRETANAMFGNSASVLVGDFLYTRSFQMMVTLDDMSIMKVLSNATNVIAEGEVLQLMNCNDPDTSVESYLQVIYCKTAKLFEAATRLAAVVTEQDDNMIKAMTSYGMHLGTAFQLVDDLLDYTADPDDMGKNVGDDLAEGKPTLPLLHAMHNGNEAQSKMIREAIELGNGIDHLDDVLLAMRETGALDFTQKMAEQEAEKAVAALSILNDSQYKQALIALAHLAVNRNA